jgi:predicted transcriptional regulator
MKQAKIITIQRKKEVNEDMRTPGIIGKIVAELVERGLKRDELAEALSSTPSFISQLKVGRGSLDDSKLGILAELHGEYTARELKAIKYLEWLENEKGLSAADIEDASRKRHRPVRHSHKDAA